MFFEHKIMNELTKSELKICNLLCSTGSFDYSYNQLCSMLDMTVPTLWSSLNKLIKKGYIKKIRFYEGRLPRNRYVALEKLSTQTVAKMDNYNTQTVANNTSDILNKTDDNAINNGDSDIKKESRRTADHFLKPIINTISSNDMINDIYNINNISKSNHIDNTVFNDSCQEENLKKLKNLIKKVPDKIDFDKTLTDIFDNFSSSTLPNNFTIGMFKDLIAKMWREKNDNSKAVIKFLNNESSDDVKEVITGVINSFCTRMLDTTKDSIKNISGYIRTSIVNAVQNFNENKTKTKQFLDSCKELINYTSKNKNAKISQNNGYFNNKIPSYKNFEQRDYSTEFFQSFYHGACLEGGV